MQISTVDSEPECFDPIITKPIIFCFETFDWKFLTGRSGETAGDGGERERSDVYGRHETQSFWSVKHELRAVLLAEEKSSDWQGIN